MTKSNTDQDLLTEAPSASAIYHREHEVIDGLTFHPWQRCQHGKQVVHAVAHWAPSSPYRQRQVADSWQSDTDATFSFTCIRHADGSVVFDEFGSIFEYNTVSQCPQCKGLGSLTTTQEQYGDTTRCSVCDYSEFFDRGD